MYEIYNIQNGDTLEKIADMLSITVDDLKNINGLDDDIDILSIKQLVVPKNSDDKYLYYTVKKGDNPYEIAKKYGIDYQMLLAINGMDDGDYIYPNETLMIPKKGFDIFMIRDNETLKDFVNSHDVSLDEIFHYNNDIYLRGEQVIFLKQK